jgi:hypothetical protein
MYGCPEFTVKDKRGGGAVMVLDSSEGGDRAVKKGTRLEMMRELTFSER